MLKNNKIITKVSGSIYSIGYFGDTTKQVEEFYDVNPFPNYNDFDNARELSNKLDENLLKALKKEASFGETIMKWVVELVSCLLLLRTPSNNIVVGLDASEFALYLADQFLDKEQSLIVGLFMQIYLKIYLSKRSLT